ncbi:MAG: hypothetical protein DRR19_21185 [Candidatus Parabeggiatoa sp. nov. 1]|nr:MAG: hypothetical protein DRR19_21185 [Gammaproteobacteria bacterium]
MKVAWNTHIVSTPEVLRGKPRIKETRIPVNLILGYLAEGYSQQDLISEFSDITTEQIVACYARELAS